jgi:hypothetical protein
MACSISSMGSEIEFLIEVRSREQGCESGLIQSGSGSGSSIFPQYGSGSTKFLNPDTMRIWIRIHKGKFEDLFFSMF